MLESYGIHISAKEIILLIATLLWLAFALYLSHQDGEHTAMTSLRLAERFLGWDEGIEPDEGVRMLNWKLRRIAHVVVYTVLAILMLLTFGEIWSGHTVIAVAVLAIIAVVDEVTKIPIEGRHCSVTDIGLNLLGVAIGAVIIVFVSALSAR